MKVKKAGCILINKETKQVAIVYRKNRNDCSFPKGHLEEGESIQECAIRETEEETGRKCHITSEKALAVLKFVNPIGEDVENYFYLAIDDGESKKVIPEELQETLQWKDLTEIEDTLSYPNLKELWRAVKYSVAEALTENITSAELTDIGICPTCFNKSHGNCLYGENTDKMLYENEEIECFLVGNPRAEGHVAISSKKHYKDMLEIPDDLCEKVFVLAKNVMNIIKNVYNAESVYLCTMCDGTMNHFHVQLIPRYSNEKRGSKNFTKARKTYKEDKEKIEEIRVQLNYYNETIE